MSFQSLAFCVFLAAALAACLTLGRRSARLGTQLLAAASLVFYLLGPGGWRTALGGLSVLLLGIAVTARAIRRMARPGASRRRTLALACVYHIALLVIFKYTGFFTGGAVEVGWAPLGLSFFTFQQLWLLKEAYTGEYAPAPGDPLLLYGVFSRRLPPGPFCGLGRSFPSCGEDGFCTRTGTTRRLDSTPSAAAP